MYRIAGAANFTLEEKHVRNLEEIKPQKLNYIIDLISLSKMCENRLHVF